MMTFLSSIQKVNEIGEAPQNGATNLAVNLRIDLRVRSEASKEVTDGVAKLGTETPSLFVVPVLGLFEVALREPTYTDLILHRLRSRSATSAHEDSESGFCSRSASLRSNSRRC